MVLLDENRNTAVVTPTTTTLTCLRLYNVQQEEDETAEDCFHKIKEIIKVAHLDIPDPVIDGAHRVGVGYNNKPPAMIVKFTTSRHRTKLYRARKEIKERLGYSLQVDLAKENLYTLKKVREIGKEYRDLTGFEFAYANINCVLYMKINGRFEKFSTLEDAYRLMGIKPEDIETVESVITENGILVDGDDSIAENSDDSVLENNDGDGSSGSDFQSSGNSGSSSDDSNDGDKTDTNSDDSSSSETVIEEEEENPDHSTVIPAENNSNKDNNSSHTPLENDVVVAPKIEETEVVVIKEEEEKIEEKIEKNAPENIVNESVKKYRAEEEKIEIENDKDDESK